MRTGYALVEKFLERYFGKRGARVLVCLILMTFGIKTKEIQKIYGPALSTTRRYRKALDNGDIESLFRVSDRVRERSKMDDYEKEILESFEESPPRTLREAQSRIETLTGLKRSLTRIAVWCQKRGFVRWQ